MPSFFSKTKSHPKSTTTNNNFPAEPADDSSTFSDRSGEAVRTPSPEKKSKSYFARERDRKERPSSKSRKSFQRDKKAPDVDTHPLNLPPDELRRLSALSVMSSPRERDSGGVPVTSEPMETTPAPETPPASASTSTPGAFPSSSGATNGVNGENHTNDHDQRPTPPPHRTPASPPPQPEIRPEEAEKFKAEGNKFYKAGKYAAAIDEYSKAIDANPTSATYLSNRAAAYMAANKFPEALEDCKRADELEPDNPKILHRLAKVYTALGRPQEALDTYDRIQPAATAKDKAPALSMKKHLEEAQDSINFKTGRFQQAVDVYTNALEVDPSNKGTNSKILNNRAMCYSRLKQWQQAIQDCDRALQLDPSYVKAQKTRAKALGESGDWDEAVRAYKNIAEQHPEEPGIAKEVRNAELELKKSKRKDYYKILGIEKDCTDNEIKKAYRKLAVIHHPDKNPDDPEAENRFKEIQEAHETLIDPQKRQRYDSGVDLMEDGGMGGGFPGGMGGFGGGGVQIDPEMLFNMMNGGMGGGGGGGFRFAGGSPFGGGGMGGGQRGGYSPFG